MLRTVRVFISSPGDVAPERRRCAAVIERLNRYHEGAVKLEAVLWEEKFYTAEASFQDHIVAAADCDVVVGILWSRLGTPLPESFKRMEDGRAYPSGTAYELLSALERRKSAKLPDVYVFRKTAPVAVPVADAAARLAADTQFRLLEAFWSEWFKAEDGTFIAAFQSFADTDAFEGQFEACLRDWLIRHVFAGRSVVWPIETLKSPFRSLEAFEEGHARVFFGRARDVERAMARLAASAADANGLPALERNEA